MVSEVALSRLSRRKATGAARGLRTYPRLAKTFMSAQLGRLGMLLTERERETA
jgi:hypothetical protein